MSRLVLAAALSLAGIPALADPAEVAGVVLTPEGQTWRIDVTIRHGDTGWDDYADGWRVETTGGEILGTRVLHHPHVEEQPFTRSLGGVAIPTDVGEIVVRTRTSTEGWSDAVSGPVPVPAGSMRGPGPDQG